MRSPDGGTALRIARTVAAGLLAAAWLVMIAGPIAAAEPSPTSAAAGDPRSAGEGPGLVGDPLFAIGIVVAIAVLSLVATLAYVRLTAPGGTGGPR
ncbi:MAG TPA: hypothetical protein VFY23_15455 [Candidatus Limnocylindrales bacterium]|nr:hypothetical protein [Candidatus Limnocylindrales bacterium]